MKSIVVIACVVIVLLALVIVCALKVRKVRRFVCMQDTFVHIPSGKTIPVGAELLSFSIDELCAFEQADLLWLEDYALKQKIEAEDENKKVKWDDLLRRIDVALSGF